MEKTIFTKKNQVLAFVYLELVILCVLLWQSYKFLGIKIVSGEILFLQNQIDLNYVYLFLINIAVFLLLYFKIALKDKSVLKIHKDFSKVVLGTAKEKVFGVERKVIVFMFFQFAFAIILAVSIAFYLDPDLEFPGFSKVPFPFNFITFVVFVVVGFYLFAKTKPFRDETYDYGFLQKKIMPAKRLFGVKRITNIKTGSVRLKSNIKKKQKSKI